MKEILDSGQIGKVLATNIVRIHFTGQTIGFVLTRVVLDIDVAQGAFLLGATDP